MFVNTAGNFKAFKLSVKFELKPFKAFFITIGVIIGSLAIKYNFLLKQNKTFYEPAKINWCFENKSRLATQEDVFSKKCKLQIIFFAKKKMLIFSGPN
jgi:hypothetical protein